MLGHIVIKVKVTLSNKSSRPAPNDTFRAESGGASKTRDRARHLLALLEQDALNKLRKDRSNRDLHVPLLSGDPGMHRHVLHCELKLHWQPPKFHHLAQAEPDGDRPDILRWRVPVSQDIARVPEAPALTKEERRNGLQVHLVRVLPEVLAADRPPLLWKHADEELLREVAYHHSGSKLPFALAREHRGRSREDGGRPGSENPVARVRRRQQLHQSQIAQPGVPREFAGGRLVRDDVVEGHHWARDQVPIFGQAHWHDRLEVPVVVPLAVVQLEVVELIRDGPEAAHRVGELPVQLARVRFCSRRFGNGTQTKILTCLKRQADPRSEKGSPVALPFVPVVEWLRRTNSRSELREFPM